MSIKRKYRINRLQRYTNNPKERNLCAPFFVSPTGLERKGKAKMRQDWGRDSRYFKGGFIYIIRCRGSDEGVDSNRKTSHIPMCQKEKSLHSSSSSKTFQKSNCQYIAHFPTFLMILATLTYKFVKNGEIMQIVSFHGLQRGLERPSSLPRKASREGRNGTFTLLERLRDNLYQIT